MKINKEKESDYLQKEGDCEKRVNVWKVKAKNKRDTKLKTMREREREREN